MTDSALDRLLEQARGPLGPNVDLDFGVEDGPLAELAALLGRMNGFFLFNGGVQVYRIGADGLGPELLEWNGDQAWKSTYQGLADPVFCFGQDLFGNQFGITDGTRVVRFDPESAAVTDLGGSLADWADWLLADPDVNGAHSFAHAYMRAHGALPVDQRLIARRPFVAGGGYEYDNLRAEDTTTAMRIRGPIAHALHDLPDGTRVRLVVE